ncbi:hypothetical protein BKA65DRAFT_475472 [Rhexocercosporidium sp. MPI-PUGE-AT-0058]|nr:hypothetical protein BKA65DRAFT_475472 [Rhexocercosporidium sp. MPI-PUGE-AT-0058]
MRSCLQFFCLAVSLTQVIAWARKDIRTSVSIPRTAPKNAGVPLENFVSFSIEFSYFPDFAGNKSHPNTFSNNLLENIASFSGSKPYVRVGGSSQDNAQFVESQKEGAILNFATPTSDQPSNLTYGPAYFESYQTWPGVHFVHGFNIAENTTEAHETQLASVPYACKALRGWLLAWQIGNEPDLLYVMSERAASYDNAAYVAEWLNLTRGIDAAVKDACPDVAATKTDWYAPSFAAATDLPAVIEQTEAFRLGLDTNRNLKVFDAHHYQGTATALGITLQGTLMNHTKTIASVGFLTNVSNVLHHLPNWDPSLPFIVGEGNSLARQGRPGLSNTFGAALWGVDANLQMASKNIQRFHMHQGTNYRYQAWQPIETLRATKGTKPPYYGNIAVAAFLGNLTSPRNRPQVVELKLQDADEFQAGYAAFVRGRMERIMLINLRTYNTTAENSNYTSTGPRGVDKYAVQVPSNCQGRQATLHRLLANGSDAISGVTFDGYSYNWELDNGKPVFLRNTTRGEVVKSDRRGLLNIEVLDSSAVMVTFQ